MSIINIIKKIIYIIVMFLVLQSCTSKRTNSLESKINSHIDKQNSNFELRLDTISTFEWDELLIAGPYTDISNINEYNLNDFPSIATDYDQDLFVGFIHKKKASK